MILDGISVQTTLWASAFSGAGGGAMSAYGETYISPLGLQRYYPSLAAFAATVDWAHLNLQPAEAALLSDDNATYQSLRISGFSRRSGQAEVSAVTHVITGDAIVPDMSVVPSFLYGVVANHNLHRTQKYHVAISHETTFEARIRATSLQAGARLVIDVDGHKAAELVLDSGSKNVGVRVPLTVGEHDITLENLGDDWLELDYLEIAQFTSPVRMLTLRDSGAGVALSWLQHRDYSWDGLDTSRAKLLFTYRIDQMPVGSYSVEIWDPLSGGVIGSEVTRVGANGVLSVDLVPMDAELALRIVRQPELETEEVQPTLIPTRIASPSSYPSAVTTQFTIMTNTPVPTATAVITLKPNSTNIVTETVTFKPTALPSETSTSAVTSVHIAARTAPVMITTSTPIPAQSLNLTMTNTPSF